MTKNEIKNIALDMVKQRGLINLSRAELCKQAGIPDGSFPKIMGYNFSYFVNELKKEIKNDSLAIYDVKKRRTDPTLRKDHILSVAVEMSKSEGYNNITRDNIAERAGVSIGLVTYYFNTMIQLKRSIIRVAIQREILEIIAQGLVNGDNHAKKAPPELKRKVAELIASY